MALIAAHLNAEIILVVTSAAIVIQSPSPSRGGAGSGDGGGGGGGGKGVGRRGGRRAVVASFCSLSFDQTP